MSNAADAGDVETCSIVNDAAFVRAALPAQR
jgi:hypothetical protein